MEIRKTTEIIKSLADMSRLRIVNALAQKPQYVEELSNRLGLAASTISFHLKKLELAGMVTGEKDQYYTVYRLNESLFALTLQQIVSAEDADGFAQEQRMERYRGKVIKAFFKKDKLQQLPAQHKKKLIVLEEFLPSFAPGREYAESEVDAIINTRYHDHCIIRRLLVEEGYMRREKHIYRLTERNNDESRNKK